MLRPVSTLCLVYAWESVLLVSLITLSILFRSVGRSASSGHLSLFRWLPRSRVANQPIHWATGWVFLLLAGVWGDGGGSVCLPLYSSSPPGGASLFLGVPCWFFSLISVFRLVFLGLRGYKPQAACLLRLEATLVKTVKARGGEHSPWRSVVPAGQTVGSRTWRHVLGRHAVPRGM